jgi:hypothetical protein
MDAFAPLYVLWFIVMVALIVRLFQAVRVK